MHISQHSYYEKGEWSDSCVARRGIGSPWNRSSRAAPTGATTTAHCGIARPLWLEQHNTHRKAIEYHTYGQSQGEQARPEGCPRLNAQLPPAVTLRDVSRQEGREHYCEEDGGTYQGKSIHRVAVRAVRRRKRSQVIYVNL